MDDRGRSRVGEDLTLGQSAAAEDVVTVAVSQRQPDGVFGGLPSKIASTACTWPP